MRFTDRVLTTTQDDIVPYVFDNFLTDSFVTFRFLGNGKKFKGEVQKYPVKIAKNNLGGSFSGMDHFNTDPVNTRKNMLFELKAYEIPVAIPGLDRLVNTTEARVIDLVSTEMESSAADGLDDVAEMFYADGTGNDGDDFDGFENLIDDTGSVGELSRAQFPTLESEVLDFNGVMTMGRLQTLYTGGSGGSSRKQKPTMIVSDEDVQNHYETLLSPVVTANYEANGMPIVTRTSKGAIPAANFTGVAGYTSFIYKGVPWVADEKATPNKLFMINENYTFWHGINDPEMTQPDFGNAIDGAYQDIPSKYAGLNWSGLMKPTNQYGTVGHIYLFGNMAVAQPRRNSKGEDILGT